MPTLYTIGHSNKTIKEFVEKLKENSIDVLVDVRSVPYSKYNPQFNREAMKVVLADAGILYVYRGKNLGGKGGKEANIGWNEAIDELIAKSVNRKLCVMCSEADPNDCHRKSTIEPDFIAKGGEIVHILWSRVSEKNGKLKKSKGFDNLETSLFG
jgi:uncharacterized protein (DUF488 family)